MTSNQPYMPPYLRYYTCKPISCQRRLPLGSELCLCNRGLNSHQCHDARKNVKNCQKIGKVENVNSKNYSRSTHLSRSMTPSSRVLSTESSYVSEKSE